jgi:hypothetical protein
MHYVSRHVRSRSPCNRLETVVVFMQPRSIEPALQAVLRSCALPATSKIVTQPHCQRTTTTHTAIHIGQATTARRQCRRFGFTIQLGKQPGVA